MIYPKLLLVAHKLAVSTQSGQLKWQATEVEGLFQTSFARSSVRIGSRQSKVDEQSNEYFIRILNADGEVVAELGDEDPRERDERIELFQALREMFEIALHQASGADEILDEIIEEVSIDDIQF